MQDNNKGKGLSTGAIVLISIVGALALALIIIIAGLMIMSSLNNGDEDMQEAVSELTEETDNKKENILDAHGYIKEQV